MAFCFVGWSEVTLPILFDPDLCSVVQFPKAAILEFFLNASTFVRVSVGLFERGAKSVGVVN